MCIQKHKFLRGCSATFVSMFRKTWFNNVLREFVLRTTVILTPGACGREVPSGRAWTGSGGSAGSAGSGGSAGSPDGFIFAHFIVFYQSKRTLTPLNPPKARHSSGMPWESLWEGLEELWESFGRLTVQCAHCTLCSLHSVLTAQCAHCTVCSLYSVLTVHAHCTVCSQHSEHTKNPRINWFSKLQDYNSKNKLVL